MKKNEGYSSSNMKGFTLIELLVVIAIIGILASVVLASLSGARKKAKIAAVQSTLASMRAQAEVGISDSGRYIENLCASSGIGSLKPLIDSLNKTSSRVQVLKCAIDSGNITTRSRRWAVEAKIDDKWYCADSTGYTGNSKSAIDPTESALPGVGERTVPATIETQLSVTDLYCAS